MFLMHHTPIMNKKLLSLSIILSSAVIVKGDFSSFNVWNLGYNDSDMRTQTFTQPFPIIFHYERGGDDSVTPDYRIARNDHPEQAPNDLPQAINDLLAGTNDVQYFEAYCKLERQNCNYFTHSWSMDRMIENRMTHVSSGMYEPHNLQPINGMIGANNLVEQVMHFHDSTYLSGNVARFQVVDMNNVADAWFVSVYNPNRNQEPYNTRSTTYRSYNAHINQQRKAIVVHWYLIPNNVQPQAKLLQDALANWYTRDAEENLTPQFVPQQ